MGSSCSTETVNAGVTVTVYTSTSTSTSTLWTIANATFTQPSTYGIALTTPWTRPCDGGPNLYYVPSPSVLAPIDGANFSSVPTPTIWEVPPMAWFAGNTSCLPPGYMSLMGLNTATPTLHPYSPAICPAGFTTVASGWNNDRREVQGLCCEEGYQYQNQSDQAAYGCWSSVTDPVAVTYQAIQTSPTLGIMNQVMNLHEGLVQGLAVPVAWKTDDAKLFPDDARPTLDPNWHIPKVLTRNEWIGVGVGTGIGAAILLIVVYYLLRRWWLNGEEKRENRRLKARQRMQGTYPAPRAYGE